MSVLKDADSIGKTVLVGELLRIIDGEEPSGLALDTLRRGGETVLSWDTIRTIIEAQNADTGTIDITIVAIEEQSFVAFCI